MDLNWNISKLECKTSENGLINIIHKIHWSCIATSSSNDILYSTEVYGSTILSSPDPNNFVSYESVTKEKVVEWLLEALGEKPLQEITAQLQSNLNEQINPSIVSLNLPWDNDKIN